MHITEQTHDIHLTNITLTNNGGACGNFYLVVSAKSGYDHEDIHVNIQYQYDVNPDKCSLTFAGLWLGYKIQHRPYV